jgi:hypothetical protein
VISRRTILRFVGCGFPLLRLAAASPEQLHFSAEDQNVKRPIILTEAALALIAKDPDVTNVLKDYGSAGAKLLTTWLSASALHLDGRGERDIVVVAKGPLSGANITTFWVLRPSSSSFELLLTVPAHDLIVKMSRSKGYRDLETLAATAVRVSSVSFRFDGSKYKPSKQKLRTIW